MRKTLLLMLLVALAMTSCEKMFPTLDMKGMFNGSSPRVNTRFEQSMAYNDTHGYARLMVPEEYRVYVCTDSHVDSTGERLAEFVRAYKSDRQKCPFALHLGDLIDGQDHFDRVDSLLRLQSAAASLERNEGALRDTLFVTLGNHDLYFSQWADFLTRYNTSVYRFETVRHDGSLLDLFICLDSGEGMLGDKQLRWLECELQRAQTLNYRHIIVYSHTHVFKQDASQGHTSNYPMEETYRLTGLLSKYGVDMYWCGHDHHREITRYGGVTYITVDAITDNESPAYYMIADIGETINYRFVQAK